MPEIVRGRAVRRIAVQLLPQIIIGEDIDANARQRAIGIVRQRFRMVRLFGKIDHAIAFVDLHHAEIAGGVLWYHRAADGEIGLGVHMRGQGLAIIHGVDMIPCEDENIFRTVGFDDIEALVDVVGGALVPGFVAEPLLGGNNIDEFPALGAKPALSLHQMLNQRVRFVLG